MISESNARDTWRTLWNYYGCHLASGSSYFLNWVQLIKIFPVLHCNNCQERSLENHTKAGNLHPSTCSSICSLSNFLSLMKAITVMQESQWFRNRQWSWFRCKSVYHLSRLLTDVHVGSICTCNTLYISSNYM